MHEHILILPDSERPVSSLVFHSRIPPPVEMDDVRGGGEVEPGAAGLQRDDEKGHPLVLLELPHQRRSPADGRFAVQDQSRTGEDGLEVRGQRRGHLAELCEDEHFLLLRRDDLRDLAQSRQLAAVGLAPRSVAEPLRRVIADLLETHQRCEHNPTTLHSLGTTEFRRQVGNRLLIERRLLAGQVAEGLHLGLVWQVGNDGLVSLQAAQDVRTHQRAQRCVRVVRL